MTTMTVKVKFDDGVDCTVMYFVFGREHETDARVVLRRAILDFAQRELGKVAVRRILTT